MVSTLDLAFFALMYMLDRETMLDGMYAYWRWSPRGEEGPDWKGNQLTDELGVLEVCAQNHISDCERKVSIHMHTIQQLEGKKKGRAWES